MLVIPVAPEYVVSNGAFIMFLSSQADSLGRQIVALENWMQLKAMPALVTFLRSFTRSSTKD